MNQIKTFSRLSIILLLLCCCSSIEAQNLKDQIDAAPKWVDNAFSTILHQSQNMCEAVDETSLLPRSIEMGLTTSDNWTSGFFPGLLWYIYEYNGEDVWRERAERVTNLVKPEMFNAVNHDIGFKIYCSFGNGKRLTDNNDYESVIIRSAKTLTSRYSYKTNLIMSWEPIPKREIYFPVIIDNMMNLELLMEAYKLSGDISLKNIAISHADKTMGYGYRDDFSCPHVVDYDPETGEVHKFEWNNGSDNPQNSVWSRGQSWGIYGYTMMYRETGDLKYLKQAENIANFLLSHPNMPKDMVPYWDYSDPKRSTMRDSSAAAIMASALMELSTYSKNGEKYFKAGEKQLKSLASSEYLATKGTHSNYILKHATGNLLLNSELDGALSYGDYYFAEGLLRYLKIKNNIELF